MAVSEIGRDSTEPQWSAANWLSILRRALVLTAVFAAGLLTGHLSTAIFAAFGALQLGLIEAMLPRLGLLKLLIVNVLSLTLVAFVAAGLGGTWWTVLLLGALAMVHGSNVDSGLLPMVTSLGCLIIAVIFAGLPSAASQAPTAALWFALGATLQSLVWLITAGAERSRSVRRMLANNVREVQRMLRGGQVNGWQSHTANLDSEHTAAALAGAGLPRREFQQASAVVEATGQLHRSVVAWRILKDPGWSDRLIVDESLRRTVAALDESVSRSRGFSTTPPAFASRNWAVDVALLDSLRDVQACVLGMRSPDNATASAPSPPDQLAPTPPVAAETAPPGSSLTTEAAITLRSLRPGSPFFRHGIRLALGIMIAQSVALLLGIGHSFWIPLTVVFVIKPDWSFTVVRSTSRFLGNLAAVVLIPLLLLAARDADWALIAVLAAISIVAFRYFTANYIAASFGVAGTILILDQALAADRELYLWRIAATIIGTAIALLVAIAIPTWRSNGTDERLGLLTATLASWSGAVFDGLIRPADIRAEALLAKGRQLRSQLLDLVPRSTAALTEPRPKTDPRLVAAAVESGQRIHLILTALAFHAVQLHNRERPGLPVADTARHVTAALERCAQELGAPPDTPWIVAPEHDDTTLTPEDLAVMAQSTHVAQASDDLLAASLGMRATTAP